METILLTIHLIVAIAMVTTILLQRSEGGALGIGGGAGGMMTARGAGDMLSKTTKWLAIIFLANSLLLGWYAANNNENASVIEQAAEQEPPAQEQILPEVPTVPEDGQG